MKLSTRSRYGLRLIFELGFNYGKGPLFLKEIAKREDISERYLGQLVIPLRNAGLIDSVRGANGGYLLKKSPAEISIKDIIEALEGDLSLVDCVKGGSSCSRLSFCVTRAVWVSLAEKIKQVLGASTLEDLLREYKDSKNDILMYNI